MSQIHQEIRFASPPARVYRALTDATEFAKFTAAKANIVAEDGGAFSCFGTFIAGRNVELVANRRIVQAWRVFNWPDGVYSIVRIQLEEKGANTLVLMDQDGVPHDAIGHVDSGWHHKYWEPLRVYLES